MNRKLIYILSGLALMGIGFASAKLIEHKKQKQVNIFERTAQEAAGIRFVKTPDSINAVFPITVEGDLFFAGEAVPLNDYDVRERLDRELQVNAYWHSNTISSMKLANRYFDEIEKILVEEGVPTDFKYIPLIESGFRDAISPAGAAGFWQFLPETAKRYGLEVTDDIDERYNIVKSTKAACAYLKEAKAELGSWTLAAASYNVGVTGMKTRLETQKAGNYYDLYLNQETSRYIFRVLAMKIIFANPHKVGYIIRENDLYQPFSAYKVIVDTQINDLAEFSDNLGVKYRDVRKLNSWIRSSKLPNKSGKTYELLILN